MKSAFEQMSSYVFCLHEDGSVSGFLPHDILEMWLRILNAISFPEPGWSGIPSDLLPDGIEACLFNARAFIQEVIMPTLRPTPFIVGDRVRVSETFPEESLRGCEGRVEAVDHEPYCVIALLNTAHEGILGIDTSASDLELLDSHPRPLLTKEWREENEQEWNRLCQPPSECPICFESPIGGAFGKKWDGPIMGDEPTRCTHLLCNRCWDALPEMLCPICRDDVSEWMFQRTQL